jgi:histidine triad (HIT) family protein
MTCLFCKIAQKEIPTTFLFEDADIMAFRDINPQAPAHFLVIPKQHIGSINDAKQDDERLLGRLVLTAQRLAQTEGFSDNGYRLVFNVNAHGGQTVHHLHLHILGERQMTWPPG